MEIVLLGTGSADGWPNAFCRCASCTDARALGVHRGPSCALVDGTLLLDAGPHLSGQAAAAGVDLAGVTTVLLTHAHSDHLDPSFLLHRSWVTSAPLLVAGPPPALERCWDWVAPEASGVEFRELHPGDVWTCGAHTVTAFAATHDAFGPALLYGIRGVDGAVLYATDTGPWVEAAAAHLAGWRFDLVVMEQTFGDTEGLGAGHLTLASFGAELDRLRALGCVDAATHVVATHLSHHNPPLADLRARLRALGAEVVPDGTPLWTP